MDKLRRIDPSILDKLNKASGTSTTTVPTSNPVPQALPNDSPLLDPNAPDPSCFLYGTERYKDVSCTILDEGFKDSATISSFMN